jgi:integrative and conjugative element protein (TIGR02256 family)
MIGVPVITAMLDACHSAALKETGGILIGRHCEDGHAARISEATLRPRDSLFGRFSFQRGTRGLRRLLEERWQRGLHYLGEWHFHPGGTASPSDTDHRSMHRIACNHDYQCSEPILIIIGGRPPSRYQISATIYPADGCFVRLVDNN